MITSNKFLQPQLSLSVKAIAIYNFIKAHDKIKINDICYNIDGLSIVEIIDCLDFLFAIGEIDFREGVFICLKN